MISKNTVYIPRLDHLRFLAAAWVFLYHTFVSSHPNSQWTSLPYLTYYQPEGFLLPLILHGHCAVGFFIVLSGFTFALITHNKNIDYRTFLFNRFLRIYPLYIFWIFLLFYSVKENNASDLFLAFFPFMDLKHNHMIQDFSTLWSTVIEVQVYLIFPFLKRFYDQKGPWFFVGLISLLLGLRFLIYLSYGSTTNLAYWTIFGRLDQFLIGFLWGVFYKKHKSSFKNFLSFPLSVVLCVIALKELNLYGGGDLFTEQLHASIWVVWPILEGLLFAFLIFSYLSWSLRFSKILETTLAKLGEISFSIYIVQFLIIIALRQHYLIIKTDDPNMDVFINWLVVLLPSALILSWATYSLIEKPFLSLRKRYVS